jgi:hypothetical protein
MPAPLSLATLTAADFETAKGDVFRLGTPSEGVDFKLVDVRKLGTARREGGAFALSFLTARGPFLEQAIYPLEHPAMGRLEMFLVPIGPVEGGNSYEAIFT